MAFTVEDGNGLPAANANITVEFADEYFADRGITAWTGTNTVKQQAIIKATDYIETVFGTRFLGKPFNVSSPPDETVDQALSFPRYYTSGVPDAPVALPNSLKKATAEYALRSLSAALLKDPTVDTSGLQVQSKSEQVGPIIESVTYTRGAAEITQSYPAADLLLQPLLRKGGTSIRG